MSQKYNSDKSSVNYILNDAPEASVQFRVFDNAFKKSAKFGYLNKGESYKEEILKFVKQNFLNDCSDSESTSSIEHPSPTTCSESKEKISN